MSKVDLRKKDFEWKHYQLANSKFLRDCFPEVKEITVKYKQQPHLSAAESNVINGKQIITPNDRFCVHIYCINDTCIHGGWNIDNKIRELIKSREELYKSETAYCGGWENDEKRYRCRSKMEYEISIDYFEQKIPQHNQ